jgi:putative transposase
LPLILTIRVYLVLLALIRLEDFSSERHGQHRGNGLPCGSHSDISTVTFRLLYVLIIINHERRKVVHFNITDSPSAAWTAQQIVNAFPYDTAPKYLLQDRDSIYGSIFAQRVKGLCIQQKLTAPRSPFQNPFIERLIGSIRRECLDRVTVLNERQLKDILTDYFAFYHRVGPHRPLSHDSPIQGQWSRQVVGLHHQYLRQAT